MRFVIQNMPQIILYKLPWADEIVIKGAIKSNQSLYEYKLNVSYEEYTHCPILWTKLKCLINGIGKYVIKFIK